MRNTCLWLYVISTIQITQINSPTITHTEEVIEEFCNDIADRLFNNKSHFKHTIEDFNAKVQKRQNQEQGESLLRKMKGENNWCHLLTTRTCL